MADYLRMVVRTNTCTGAPDFAGVEKAAAAEALAPTDCRETSNAQQVTITELQAFGTATTLVETPSGVVPDTTGATSPRSAGRGSLPATGANTPLVLGGLVLLALAGAAARRRLS